MRPGRAPGDTKPAGPSAPAQRSAYDPESPRLAWWAPPLLYLLLAAAFLWRSTLTGRVFLPAGLLYHVAPWSALPHGSIPPWNPLRWDGIAQFYPWRLFAAEALRSGIIPLWNPRALCGTPFVANSQSAVFYPGNLIFLAMPAARAFGVSALLHLAACGWFTYLLARRIRCGQPAALFAGVVYAFCAWQTAWLQLPTFLCVSCWIPLLLCRIDALAAAVMRKKAGEPFTAVCAAGLVAGLMLLAGHLQIALYGLLAGALWIAACALRVAKSRGAARSSLFAGLCGASLLVAVAIDAPQLLPTLELSRVSHRVSRPSAAGYRDYASYALAPAQSVLLTLPDFYGNDRDEDNPYWGFYLKSLPGGGEFAIRHNAAETACYVGVLTLLFGLTALRRGLTRAGRSLPVAAFGALALLSLLMALGTPIDALLYFCVPGFGQSGSPARVLVLWALAWAMLGALGLDSALRSRPCAREIAHVFVAFVLIFTIGLSLASRSIATAVPGFDALHAPLLAEVFARIGQDWIRLICALAIGAAVLSIPLRMKGSRAMPLPAILALGGVVAELFAAGMGLNPTALPEEVYPETPGIVWLRANAGHERIMPVNRRWSLYSAPPAVLPPNAAGVFGLMDVQGYDSLFTGVYKAFANGFALPNRAGVRDASPPEVGNMVFIQDPNAAGAGELAARFAVTPDPHSRAFATDAAPEGSPEPAGDAGMAIWPVRSSSPRAEFLPDSGAPAESGRWMEDGATRVALSRDGVEACRLSLHDAWYPGWRAEVDGKPAAVEPDPQKPIFRRVAVPAGARVVRLRYEPASFRLGLFAACVAAGLLAAAATRSHLGAPRAHASQPAA